MYWGWVFFTMISTALSFIAAVLVVYIVPAASGAGTSELIAYLNGINFSSWFGLKIFLIKSSTIVLASVGGLCVGNT